MTNPTRPDPATPLLEVDRLWVSYRTQQGRLPVVEDVSLRIAAGEALGVVGESGSGKSTVAAAILDLMGATAEIDGGVMRFEGRDLSTLSRTERRGLLGDRIGTVFQDPFTALNPSLRVGHQIAEPLMLHRGLSVGQARAAAKDLLAEMGIAEPGQVADAYPHQLSGGMKQRALIAAAVACEPSLMILDEPTTALDVTIEAQILELLANLRRRSGIGMLFISHNLAVVRQVCDQVLVLYAGRVLEQASVDQLFARPKHPYTRGLIRSLPRIGAGGHRRLTPIPGSFPDLATLPDGCVFHPRCEAAEARCATTPQALSVARDGRRVRCWKADALGVDAAIDAQLGEAPPRGAAGEPLVVTKQVSRTFATGGGLASLQVRRTGPILRRLALVPKTTIAVDRVDLTIHRGEVLGLVGESGSGKSTLGRLVLNLLRPTTGSVSFDGRILSELDRRALAAWRRDAQIVFQNPDSSLNPRRTVREIVGRPLQLFGTATDTDLPAEVDRLLDMVRIKRSYADRFPFQLSGGEKQRVSIARALATRPKFLVLDEAVSALDVSVQAAIVNLLSDLHAEQGLSYLFISHDLSVIAHLSDRIAVMYRGAIVELGTTAEVLAPPYHPYTETLLRAVPRIDRPLAPLLTGSRPRTAPVSDHGAGCRFHDRCALKIGVICETLPPPIQAVTTTHRFACHHSVGRLSQMADALSPALPIPARVGS